MNDEDAFLRAMVANPDDPAPRLLYADWLDERGDPRAAVLRADWNPPRLSYADWIARLNAPDAAAAAAAAERSRDRDHRAAERWRRTLAEAAWGVDRAWTTIVDTFAQPFQPFRFWDHAQPDSPPLEGYPLAESLGARGAVLTFASQFRDESIWRPGLIPDVDWLRGLAGPQRPHASSSWPIYPLIAELGPPPEAAAVTARDVLAAIHAVDFRGPQAGELEFVDLEAPSLEARAAFDSIHTDPDEQDVFPRPNDPDAYRDAAGYNSRHATHQCLRAIAADGRLWYVSLHRRAADPSRGFGPWVAQLAVGRSARGNWLVGMVTYRLVRDDA